MSSISYRMAEPDDFAVTYDIVTEAMTDFRVRQHRFEYHRPSAIQQRDMAVRQFAFRFCRESFWIAEHESRIVGFAIALRRPGYWLLAALHVLPRCQGKGIGRRLLDLALSSAHPSDVRCCVMDAVQAVAKRLYIHAGMLPWVPLLEWNGAPPETLSDTADDDGIRLETTPQKLEPIDQHVLCASRPREHELWMQQPGVSCGLLTTDGEPAGYVYVSDCGDVGPLAVTAEPLAVPLLFWALRRLKEQGADRIHLKIPGHAPSAQEFVRTLGLSSIEPTSMLLTSRPLWSPGLYLVSAGDAIL